MIIQAVEGGYGDHDSKYTQAEVIELVRQAGSLAGIRGEGTPAYIAAFAKDCVDGDATVFIKKGIHQRWSNKNKSPEPHITFYFESTSERIRLSGHVFLSQQLAATSIRGRGSLSTYRWHTVGISISAQKNGPFHLWPAMFSIKSIEVDGIQSQSGRRKRRDSVNLNVGTNVVSPPFIIKEEDFPSLK
jgi:hypothetical protein